MYASRLSATKRRRTLCGAREHLIHDVGRLALHVECVVCRPFALPALCYDCPRINNLLLRRGTMAERADEAILQAGATVKRRGILAAAGAAVAALIAKQASVPVGASGGFIRPNFTASGTGNPNVGFDASAGTFDFGAWGFGTNTGVRGDGGVYGVIGSGLQGVRAFGNTYGVYAYGTASGT